MPYQPNPPPPFGHPFMTIPNHQNLTALPVSRNESESVLDNCFRALKVENDELRKEEDNLRQGMNMFRHPTLPPRPPTAEINTPVLPISSIRTQKLSLRTFLLSINKIVTVNSENPWTVVGSSRTKSKKTQGSHSFPTPLKTLRLERERRSIFRWRAKVPPSTQNVAIEIFCRPNKALQGKRLPAYIHFLKLGYKSAGNLTGLVLENNMQI
ncbi:hypothetical protein OnM2_051075 [Erysiphe neolycopersici]|uniref:Uncharacterized protein n=1 Tax=Erysiphe neolycopersici TaxID=212602 RepID=A0A420HSK4_9PEZI|nr:hypothetical protein OnM2_051075 [Erysiphe neolycopersici]